MAVRTDHSPAVSAPAAPAALRLPVKALLAGAALVVLLIRGWSRVAHPTLWAEDGQVFLTDGYDHPVTALWEPYRGYLHLVPRLIAALASRLPLTWLPTVYTLAAVATAVAIACLVLSDRMRRLLPRPWQPPLALAVLVLLPAADEPFGNLANLIFHAGLALLLLSLCDDPRSTPGRYAELAALAVLGLSGPFALPLAVTAFAARWWLLRTRHAATAAGVVFAAGVTQWLILLAGPRVDAAHLSADALPRFAGRNIAGGWLFGDRWTGHWTAPMTVAVLAFGAAFALVAWRWVALGPVLGVLATVTSALAAWGYFPVHPYSGQRHVLLPLALIAVLTVAGLSHGGWRRWVAAACLLAGLGGVIRTAAIRPLPFRPIGPLADCLAAGKPTCSVQVNPPGARWQITLHPR
jgi:hypothetical protein